MKKLMTILTLTGSLALPGTVFGAAAQQSAAVTKPAPAVKVTLTQDRIKTISVGGKSTEAVIASPKTVLPGDVLREEVTVVNVAGKAVRNPVITVPVPKGTVYVTSSATASGERWNTQYSTDSGKSYSATPMKTVTVTENGKTVTKQVAASASEYTNVRWMLTQLNAAESLKLSFRVRVN